MRRLFGPKGVGLRGGWRKLHSEELLNLFFSTDVNSMIKSKKVIWAGRVEGMGEKITSYKVLVGITCDYFTESSVQIVIAS
jgi:hypothetical protein